MLFKAFTLIFLSLIFFFPFQPHFPAYQVIFKLLDLIQTQSTPLNPPNSSVHSRRHDAHLGPYFAFMSTTIGPLGIAVPLL